MAAIPPPPGKAPPTSNGPPPPATPASKPLQKPPGYRDPSTPAPPTPNGAPPRRTPAAPPPPPARLNRPIPPPAYRSTNGNSSSSAATTNGNGKPYQPYRATNGTGGRNNYPSRGRTRRACCSRRRCCCCFCAVLLLLLLALALAGGVAYLLLQPKPPEFRLQTLRVPLLRVSVRPDGTFLDANASAAVLAANPNGKLDLLYKDGRMRISAEDDEGDVAIGDPMVFDGFAQTAGNSTVLRMAAKSKGAVVGDAVGTRLRARFQSGDLRFVVEVRTRVAVKVKGGEKVHVPVRVRCGGVTLKQLGGVTATGDRRGRADAAAGNKCKINLIRW